MPAFMGYHGFPATLCASVEHAGRARHPVETVDLREGDILSVDVGAIVDGYYGDNARDVPGRAIVTTRRSGCWTSTRASLEAGIAQCVAGHAAVRHRRTRCRRSPRRAGFSVVREYVGHGIGRAMHEEPKVPNYGPAGTGPTLKPGMVLAIEPMVNAGGAAVERLPDGWTVVTRTASLSAHFEHTVAVTEDGPLDTDGGVDAHEIRAGRASYSLGYHIHLRLQPLRGEQGVE